MVWPLFLTRWQSSILNLLLSNENIFSLPSHINELELFLDHLDTRSDIMRIKKYANNQRPTAAKASIIISFILPTVILFFFIVYLHFYLIFIFLTVQQQIKSDQGRYIR